MEFLLELIAYFMLGCFIGIGIIFLISVLPHRSFFDTAKAISKTKKQKEISEEARYWEDEMMMRQKMEFWHDFFEQDDKDDQHDK